MKIKYPRTMNLPNSESITSDDVWWDNFELFKGQEIVISEKLDGEATTIYPDGSVHARSLDSGHHPARSWVKQLASQIGYQIPEGMRICGENMYAYHSIYYIDLPTYFFVYGIYDKENNCLPWDEVVEFCQLLDLQTVPVLYRGLFDEKMLSKFWTGKGTFPTFRSKGGDYPTYPDDFTPCDAEGYVIRLARQFHYDDFAKCCAKFVAGHFKGTMRNIHWGSTAPLPNLLKESN